MKILMRLTARANDTFIVEIINTRLKKYPVVQFHCGGQKKLKKFRFSPLRFKNATPLINQPQERRVSLSEHRQECGLA